MMFAMLLLVSITCQEEDLYVSMVDQAIESTNQAVEQYPFKISKMKKQIRAVKNDKRLFSKDRQKQVDELNDALEKMELTYKDLKSGSDVYIGDLLSTEVGSFGNLSKHQVTVTQIINDQDFLGKLRLPNHNVRVDLYFEGFSLKNVADGQTVDLKIPIFVSGTKTYKTVLGGSKTVLVAKPLDVEKLRELVLKKIKKAEK